MKLIFVYKWVFVETVTGSHESRSAHTGATGILKTLYKRMNLTEQRWKLLLSSKMWTWNLPATLVNGLLSIQRKVSRYHHSSWYQNHHCAGKALKKADKVQESTVQYLPATVLWGLFQSKAVFFWVWLQKQELQIWSHGKGKKNSLLGAQMSRRMSSVRFIALMRRTSPSSMLWTRNTLWSVSSCHLQGHSHYKSWCHQDLTRQKDFVFKMNIWMGHIGSVGRF